MTGPAVTCRLLVTSGNGPAECRIAVKHVLCKLSADADQSGVAIEIATPRSADEHGPASAVASLFGGGAEGLAEKWIGTIKWSAKSRVRPNHRRSNWFVGVFLLDQDDVSDIMVEAADVRFESLFRKLLSDISRL